MSQLYSWSNNYLKSGCSIISLLSINWSPQKFDEIFELAIKYWVFLKEGDWNFGPMLHKNFGKLCRELGLHCIKLRYIPLFLVKILLRKWFYFLTSLKGIDGDYGHIVRINQIIEEKDKTYIEISSPTRIDSYYYYSDYCMSYNEFKEKNRWYVFMLYKKR